MIYFFFNFSVSLCWCPNVTIISCMWWYTFYETCIVIYICKRSQQMHTFFFHQWYIINCFCLRRVSNNQVLIIRKTVQAALWYLSCMYISGARGGAVGWGAVLQARKVAGSIPNGVIGIFHWHNPSGRTMALGLTQPLTEMSTRNISWGVKAAGA